MGKTDPMKVPKASEKSSFSGGKIMSTHKVLLSTPKLMLLAIYSPVFGFKRSNNANGLAFKVLRDF